MSDNTQSQVPKNESEKSNESKPTQESSTKEKEAVSVVVEAASSVDGKNGDDDQEKMDVDEDTACIESQESHTEVPLEQASVEEKNRSSGDQSNIIEDVHMDDKKDDSQDEVNDRREGSNAKGTQQIAVEDVDMDKPRGDEQTPANPIKETSTEESKNLPEDVTMTEEMDTNEKEAPESSDRQLNPIISDENAIIKDTEAVKDTNEKEAVESSDKQPESTNNDEDLIISTNTEATKDNNAGQETNAEVSESAEMDCTETNDAEKASEVVSSQEVVSVDTVDNMEVHEDNAKSNKVNKSGNNAFQESIAGPSHSQNNDDADVVFVKESIATVGRKNKYKKSKEEKFLNQMASEPSTSGYRKTPQNSNLNDEHSIFVQVNNEKDDNEKPSTSTDHGNGVISEVLL